MSPLDTLSALARGEAAALPGLLPACRAQAFGAEAFGPAEVLALFARAPAPLSPTPAVVAGARAFALSDADAEGREQGWFADLYDGLVARIWRVGPAAPGVVLERAPGLAFDPFLSQACTAAALRADDHPELAPEAFGALASVAEVAARDPGHGVAPARALVVRALSSGDRGAALLSQQGRGVPPRLGLVAFRFQDGRDAHSRCVWDAAPPVEGLGPAPL